MEIAFQTGTTTNVTEFPQYARVLGRKQYELTDHLGNVRALFGKATDNSAQVEGYTDYYPFGMEMPNRQFTLGSSYRFGYQGQFAEKDEETGYNHFEARDWDGRIGRWMAPDPAGQFFSPYLGMGNNPVSGVDPDGRFWQEMGNFLKHGMWVSNEGIDFYNNADKAFYNGPNSIGFRNGEDFGVKLFKPVNDYWDPHNYIWNTSIVRAITGDALIIPTFGFNLAFVEGGGWEGQLIIPFRGPQAFNGYLAGTYKFAILGGHGAIGINGGKATFNGPVDLIDVQRMGGSGVSLEGDFVAGAGIWASHEKGKITWWGTSFGGGLGVGLSLNLCNTKKIIRVW